MMIIVAGTISIEPSQIEAFERAVKVMIGEVRQEDGCVQYSLLVEERKAGLINVLELWRDEAALRVHLKLPMIANFFGRFAPHIVSMKVEVFDAINARPVPM